MCTVSWHFTSAGYEVYFNRDESRSRAPARPPEETAIDGVRYLAPTDGDAGGAWLAVNEFRVFVGLLNAYPDPPPPEAAWISRGALVRALSACRDVPTLRRTLARADLARYRPFTLLTLAPGETPFSLAWDGRRALERALDERNLLCSSSVASEAALSSRRAVLERLRSSGRSPRQAHLDFHRSHLPERGPLSTCMHRPDARTVSFCHVAAGELEVELRYSEGPPCSAVDHHRVSLRRGAPASSTAGS